MAAATMASLSVTISMPAVVCSGSSAKVSSSASFGGTKLDGVTAAPAFSRSSRSLVVRAGEKPNLWDSIKSAFGGTKENVTDTAAQGEKEVKKAASEAKSSSGDLGGKAEEFKAQVQAQAEEAAEGVKSGIEDLKNKVESTKTN